MSELGAARLRAALNSRLPPIWPGEPPIRLELVRAGCSNCFAVTVPTRFHNRLHRFPFEDGFLAKGRRAEIMGTDLTPAN